jgi:outer membrane protein insertion porin family
MRTIQFGFGYRWRESNLKEHELNPISLSNTTIRNKSATFNELLESNPFLKKSYEEQFIAGANYTFTYNEQVLQFRKIQFLLIAAAETAGNAFSLAHIIAGEKPSAENPSKVIGSVYSQFAKLSLDGRGYYNFRSTEQICDPAFYRRCQAIRKLFCFTIFEAVFQWRIKQHQGISY